MHSTVWHPEKTDDDGARTQVFMLWGCPSGFLIQFPSNAPTTYAEAFGQRLGAFESWEAARSKVERIVSLKHS